MLSRPLHRARLALGAVTPLERIGVALSVAGASAMLFGLPYGALAVFAGAAIVAVMNPWHYLLLIAAVLPSTIGGWTGYVLDAQNGAVDARALLSLGLGIVGMAMAMRAFIAKPWPLTLERGIEWIGLVYLGYEIFDGLYRSDGNIWLGSASRWALAYGAFVLARTYSPRSDRVRHLVAAAMLGAAVPSAVAVLDFAVGPSNLQNGALRATGIGASGPVAVAFAGQMALLLGFYELLLVETWRRAPATVASVVVGALAIVGSATRLILGTAYLAIVASLAIARRWRWAGVATAMVVLILVVRPDFASRFGQAIDQTVAGTDNLALDDPAHCNSPADVADASLRFRLFIWARLLEAWQQEPVLGIGPGMTPRVITCAVGVVPHNSYVRALAETGIVGFVLFVGLQVLVLILLFRQLRAPTGPPWRNALTAASLAVFLSFNVLGALDNPGLFISLQFTIWALIGASLGQADQGAKSTDEAGS